MLRVFDVCVEMVAAVRVKAKAIGKFDRDLARQLRRASCSVPLNVAEACGVRGGNSRLRFETALGSARETRAGLKVAVAAGYLTRFDPGLDDQLDRICATLYKLPN